MKIGVAKEIKKDEYRVALTIAGARELVHRGHEVVVETGAGDGSSSSWPPTGARSCLTSVTRPSRPTGTTATAGPCTTMSFPARRTTSKIGPS